MGDRGIQRSWHPVARAKASRIAPAGLVLAGAVVAAQTVMHLVTHFGSDRSGNESATHPNGQCSRQYCVIETSGRARGRRRGIQKIEGVFSPADDLFSGAPGERDQERVACGGSSRFPPTG